METHAIIDDYTHTIEFKSYYVVWKQFDAGAVEGQTFVFKSYYVVWKQNKIKQNGKMRLEFKSYYVVWKLEWLTI